MMKRRCVMPICVRSATHETDTRMSGTPGCVTKVGMILSTGLLDAVAMADQKSSDVAFA